MAEETSDSSNPVNPGNFRKCKLLPDAAAVFTRGMGMSCTWDEMGERSWRYAMVVKDMVIEKMFLEGGEVVQNAEADPFEVSKAEYVLQYCKDNKGWAPGKK